MSAGLIVVFAVILVVVAAAARAWWRRRIPEPLRGDWWSSFERDFHQWAASRPGGRQSPRPSRRDPR